MGGVLSINLLLEPLPIDLLLQTVDQMYGDLIGDNSHDAYHLEPEPITAVEDVPLRTEGEPIVLADTWVCGFLHGCGEQLALEDGGLVAELDLHC